MTRIRTNVKRSNRNPRIIYTPNLDEIKTNIMFIDPSQADPIATPVAYTNTTPTSITTTYGTGGMTGCTNNTTGQLKRVCHVLWYIKTNRQVKYLYYLGHQYTWDVVLQRKEGNCCDLARLADRVAKETGLGAAFCGDPLSQTKYVKGVIEIKGTEYNHVWNQFLANNEWRNVDMVNYILTGNTAPLGKVISITNYVQSGTNPC